VTIISEHVKTLLNQKKTRRDVNFLLTSLWIKKLSKRWCLTEAIVQTCTLCVHVCKLVSARPIEPDYPGNTKVKKIQWKLYAK